MNMKIIWMAVIMTGAASSAMALELERVNAAGIAGSAVERGNEEIRPARVDDSMEKEEGISKCQGLTGVAGGAYRCGWKHIKLRATDKTAVNVDYRTKKIGSDPTSGDTSYVYTDSVWINVVNPAYSGRERVRVVLGGNMQNAQQTVDLEYAGEGRYTAALPRELTLVFHHHGTDYEFNDLTLSVVVDGNWLVDPANGTHNFKFKMS